MTNSQKITVSRVAVWGKTDQLNLRGDTCGTPWNPLLAHLLDVAACAGELWDRYLARPVRDRLVEALGAGDADTARRNAMFYAALHDLGKASACFQLQFARTPRRHLREAGAKWLRLAHQVGLPLPADHRAASWIRHEHITAFQLPRLLGCTCRDCGGTGERHDGLHRMALLLGGHHGHIPSADTVQRAKRAVRDGAWDDLHRYFVDALADLLEVDLALLADRTTLERPATLPVFAGLVVTADWLASDEQRFAYRRTDESAAQWWEQSKKQARAALTALRLDAWSPKSTTWAELFPRTPTPRQFQNAAMAAAPAQGPVLAIVEAGTGSGKTALALWYAHHLARTNGYHGFYTAMPSRAATDQAAVEHIDFLTEAFGTPGEANLAIVHGTAEATENVGRLLDAGDAGDATGRPTDFTELIPFIEPTLCEHDDEAHSTRAVLDPWYLRRCVGLLSTFGIGTIDQIALAAQRSEHWFLRLFGLANKTVVIDEGHAYELFQERLLEAAVAWLADAGASVVVLSATLPSATREALVHAWCRGHRTTPQPTDTRGPVTLVDRHGQLTHASPDEAPPQLHTRVELRPDPGPVVLAGHLLHEAATGGIIAVVRNRVDAAHDLYTQARAEAAEHGWHQDEIVLLHGQMLSRDRLPIESRIRRLLGPAENRTAPNPDRPHRLLIIATQVIEQSLDLDSDRLYTDLAPVDLLIQRRGRLHRHASNDAHRPAGMRAPRMTVLWQPDHSGLPLVHPPTGTGPGNPDGHVYAPYALAATHHLLDNITHEPACPECQETRDTAPGIPIACLSTPRDNERLIEAVYNPGPFAGSPMGALLSEAWNAWIAEHDNHENTAYARALQPYLLDGSPTDIDRLKSGSAEGQGDDGSAGLAARSRLGEPTTDVIVLFRQQAAGAGRPRLYYSYDQGGLHEVDSRYYRARDDSVRNARRAQERDRLLNTVPIPHSWFRHLPPVERWYTLSGVRINRRHVIVFAPDGACLSGPVGRLRYSPTRGVHPIHRP
ncbi:CRISPR-associated helicase Cas3' [Kitasatospora sp. NPDC017646]|uniref:CRISPR-associated helicase Cas3' n=1 Tax=Kitasatospora sp. NPDC017646 TaxID=3364024 RepID=UPI00378ECD3F